MDDKTIITIMMEKAGISNEHFEKLWEKYQVSNSAFIISFINYHKSSKIFLDYYVLGLCLNKIMKKYLMSRYQLRQICKSVLDVELFLSLSKVRLDFKDPLYERGEFDEYTLNSLGLRYEPIRLLLMKKYNLIEREKNDNVYIIQKDNIKQMAPRKVEEKVIIFEDEIEKLFNEFDEIEINDVLKMKKYLQICNSELKPNVFEKIYEEVERRYFQSGYNLFISREKAMLTREWSLAKINGKVKVDINDINKILYKAIKNKDN